MLRGHDHLKDRCQAGPMRRRACVVANKEPRTILSGVLIWIGCGAFS
jgi:hypothetical protein